MSESEEQRISKWLDKMISEHNIWYMDNILNYFENQDDVLVVGHRPHSDDEMEAFIESLEDPDLLYQMAKEKYNELDTSSAEFQQLLAFLNNIELYMFLEYMNGYGESLSIYPNIVENYDILMHSVIENLIEDEIQKRIATDWQYTNDINRFLAGRRSNDSGA